MPVVIATDYHAVFACYLASEDERVVAAEFVQCVSVRLGLPNDEVLHGHPCGRDLMHYGVHVIHDSPWIEELRSIESVHEYANRHPVNHARHYFLTFHDSCLEACASDVRVIGDFDSMADAIDAMRVAAGPM